MFLIGIIIYDEKDYRSDRYRVVTYSNNYEKGIILSTQMGIGFQRLWNLKIRG